MTPCPPRSALQDLLAERLPPDQEAAVLAHVETCSACQEALEELTACCAPHGPAATGRDSAPPPAEPSSEKDAFWQGLKAAVPRGPSTSAPGRAGGAAAVALPARLGRYELLEEIGRGGMGAVLRGHDPDLGRELAVKVLLPGYQDDPVLVSRFTEEAQIGGQLQHPGIVPVYEVGRSPDQRPYFTMKLVQGRTLATLLGERSHPGQDMPRLLQVFEQVCQTMAYAHSRGVIHRDLKPDNVMVGAFGEVQIMDWGLAKVLHREGTASPPGPQPSGIVTAVIRTVRSAGSGLVSEPGQVMGTPAYMAPEQASGAMARLDERCDVFGLGAILCEILTGQPPYRGADHLQVLHQAARADLDEASARLDACGASPELIRLARSSLAAEAADRHRDAGVLAAELAAHRESMEARLRQAELAQARAEEERKRRRVQIALVAAGLALVLLAAGGGLWLLHVQTERRTELRRDVSTAVAQAVSFRKGFHFDEARELLDQAGQRLGMAGPDELRRQVDQAWADLKLAEGLDRARLRTMATVEERNDFAGAERLYAAAFADAGLGREGDDVAAVAARVQTSPLRAEIVAALDDWASITGDLRRRAWLLEVARKADPDPARDRLRQPDLWRDRRRLTQLAQELRAAELSPQLATALGRVARSSGGEAVALLTATQARFPQDFWVNYELGSALSDARRWDEALGYYRAALALRPEAALVHSNLGLLWRDRGRLDEALVYVERAFRLEPSSPVVHINLGVVLRARGRPDEALDHFQQAVRLDPKHVVAHNVLGGALIDRGRLDEALIHFQQAVDLEPGSALAHHNLAGTLEAKGRPDEALRHLQQAVRLDPKLAVAHNNLGMLLHARGRPDEALDHFRQAVRLEPRSGGAHYNLGMSLHARGRTDEAIRHLQQAVRLDPKLAVAHNNLGMLLRDRGRTDEAIGHFQQVVRLEPRSALAHYNLGGILKDKGRPDDAIRHFQQAVRLDPKLTAAYPYLSACLYAAATAAVRAADGQGSEKAPLGEPERARLRRQALDRLRANLELTTRLLKDGQAVSWSLAPWQTDPALASVRDRVALAKLPDAERQQWQRLWADVAALLAADPVTQGRAHAARRDWTRAAECYTRASKRSSPDDGPFWFEHAAVLLLSGDRPGYVRVCARMVERCGGKGSKLRAYYVARACTLAPDAVPEASLPGRLAESELKAAAGQFWSLTEQGALHYRAGRFPRAVALFEQSLRADTKSGRAVLNWLWLALAQQRLGKSEEARRWLDKATAWLDQYRDGMPNCAEEELGLHLHNWLEAHVLRREAEVLLRPVEKRYSPGPVDPQD
jgi:serine/threonine-protein kinase